MITFEDFTVTLNMSVWIQRPPMKKQELYTVRPDWEASEKPWRPLPAQHLVESRRPPLMIPNVADCKEIAASAFQGFPSIGDVHSTVPVPKAKWFEYAGERSGRFQVTTT